MVYAVAMADRVDAGFAPEALDPALEAARARLTSVVVDVERIRGGLEPCLDKLRLALETRLLAGSLEGPELAAEADRQITWLERYARVAGTFVKIVDETARLRSFLAGGADSRPDLSSLSDVELRKVIKGVLTKAEEKAE